MKRIVLAISSLGMGGAESVLAWLARGLGERGNSVTVLTLDDGSEPPFFTLPAEVHHRPLGIAGDSSGVVAAVGNNLRRIRVLRRAIMEERPDVVISFMDQTNILALLAVGGKCPVIVSERTHPDILAGTVWRWLRRRVYGRAAAVVVQTGSIQREYPWLREGLLTVIPNAVRRPEAKASPDNPSQVVGLGRLHHLKGFDLLLRAFAVVAEKRPEWSLVIHGEGPARDELEALTVELGLEERVFLPGRTRRPHEAMARGSIFAFPSRWEGFPNALAEAMAVGLPCVAADCPGGPADFMTHGHDGLLVPAEDVKALARALDTLMGDAALRTKLGAEGAAIVERFGEERVLDMWTECIDRVTE